MATTVYMSLEDMNNNIKKMTQAKESIQSEWNVIRNENVERLKQSWIGNDCDAYIKKLMEMDTQMQNAIEALQLLVDTYNQAKNQILATQQNVSNSANNL